MFFFGKIFQNLEPGGPKTKNNTVNSHFYSNKFYDIFFYFFHEQHIFIILNHQIYHQIHCIVVPTIFRPIIIMIDEQTYQNAFYDGFQLAIGTLLITILLEFICWKDTVLHGVWKQPNGKELYYTSWFYNFRNHLLLGIPIYMIAVLFFCTTTINIHNDDNDNNNHKNWKEDQCNDENHDGGNSLLIVYNQPLWQQYLFGKTMTTMIQIPLLIQVIFMIFFHSIQYYMIHKLFHESTTLYQLFHRFHHRFHTYIPPSSANAVTIGEYMIAYILPFVPPLLLAPIISSKAMKYSAGIISLMNLFVHCPQIENWSKQYIPSFFVSTENHLNHHRKLNCHYASPTFNIDYIMYFFTTSTPSTCQTTTTSTHNNNDDNNKNITGTSSIDR